MNSRIVMLLTSVTSSLMHKMRTTLLPEPSKSNNLKHGLEPMTRR